MKHIYYKNDFAVEITLLNASGEVVSPPEWQWHIEFTDGRRKYICSVEKGNAKVVGNTIMCYLDNHKFCCGEVGYKFVQAIPDLNYLDGFQNLITPKALPIELWEQGSDNDINIQSSVVPAYVVYDAYQTAKANGYTGTAEDFYDALIHIVDINTAEAERVKAEANRVSAEQQRVENFEAMESALTTATSKANTATTKADVATSNATQATTQATTATNRANDISADLEAKREADYWRGVQGIKGDDGVSPTVSTSKTGKVTTIKITDAQGTHTTTVNDGESVDVVQSTGTSEVAVMSQRAVTEAVEGRIRCGRNLYPSEVVDTFKGKWDKNGVYSASNDAAIVVRITEEHKGVWASTGAFTAFICDSMDEGKNLVNPVMFDASYHALTAEDVGKLIVAFSVSGYGNAYFSEYGRAIMWDDLLTRDEYNASQRKIDSINRRLVVNDNMGSSTTNRRTPLTERIAAGGAWIVSRTCIDSESFDNWAYFVESKKSLYLALAMNCRLREFKWEYGAPKITATTYAFSNCRYLASVDLRGLDTSACTNMSRMFYSCSSLASVDLRGLDTSACTNMSAMFYSCSSLASVDLRGLDTSACTNMSLMFYSCSSLASLIGGSQDLNEVAMVGLNTFLSLWYTDVDRASIRAVFNGLKDLTGAESKKIELGKRLRNKLTSEDIEIATNKNWILT